METNRLKIAVQKSGRLSEDGFDLLKKCGLDFSLTKRGLICKIEDPAVDLLLLRDDDVPTFVAKGVCDIGIIGENVLKEKVLTSKEPMELDTIMKLGFSKCRLSIAIARDVQYNGPKDMQGKTIVTSYPGILKEFFAANGVEANVVKMEGSVEIGPQLGLSDAICDIVSSGATLEAHGLKEVQTMLKSEAVLISRKNLNAAKTATLNRLLERIKAVKAAEKSKYVMLNAPKEKMKEIAALLPGAESPTIMPLADENKVAMHAVCKEPLFWSTMEKLKESGATSILVLPIEKLLF